MSIPDPDSTPGRNQKLYEALDIRPEEIVRTSELFVYLFLVGVIFTTGRTARDALFLTAYPVQWLPWMSVAYGVVSALTIPVYATYASRLRVDRLNGWFAVCVAVAYCAAWGLLKTGWTSVLPALYVFVEITSNLLVVQFWTLAGDLHDAREAKRLFGIIGSSRMIGIVVCGLSVGAMVGMIGTQALLLVNAVLLFATAFMISRIGSRFLGPGQATSTRTASVHSATASLGNTLRSGYSILIIALFLLAFMAATVADYQFKVIARQHYSGEKLAAYFALFYGLTGALAFVFHFFISSRLLALFGMAAGLLVMPLFMGASSIWLWLGAGSLMAATVLKFSDNAFQFTINDSALQLLYYPFSPQVKTRIKSVIEGAIKPLGYAAGGLIVVWLGSRLGPVGLSWVCIFLIVLWVTVIVFLRRSYLKALVDSLVQRKLDSSSLELVRTPEVIGLLRRTVESGNTFQAEFALKNLASISPADAAAAISRMLGDPDRQKFALDHAGSLPLDRQAVRRLAETGSREVRLSAIRVYGDMAGEETLDYLPDLVRGDDPEIADTACISLMRSAGVEGVLATAEHIRSLLSGTEAMRLRAVRILGETEVTAFGRTLLRLVHDESRSVQIQALSASGRLKHPCLLTPLVAALGDWRSRSAAVLALEEFGSLALGYLSDSLKSAEVPMDIRLRIPKLLRRIGTGEAIDVLWSLADHEDDRLRYQILRNLSRCAFDTYRRSERGRVETLLDIESRSACHWFARRRRLLSPSRASTDELLQEALRRRLVLCGRRVLDLLRMQIGTETVLNVQQSLESGNRNRIATALEALENLLTRDQRSWIVPLLDGSAWNEAENCLGRRHPDCVESNDQTVSFLRSASDPYLTGLWLRAMEAGSRYDELNRLQFQGGFLFRICIEEIYQAVHDDPAQRQELLELGRIYKAKRIIDHSQSYDSPGGPYRMLTTLERVLFLKSVSLFQQVPGDELIGLAHEAHVVTYDNGEVIFRQGDPGDSLYLLVTGNVRIFAGDNDLARLGPGECFGEMAILDNATRSASVSAIGPVLALRITQEDFFDILGDHPEISRGIFAVLVSRLRRADARVEELMVHNPAAGASARN